MNKSLDCYKPVRLHIILAFFFFQAEDGIRDLTVTGVQTCALPIYLSYTVQANGDLNTTNWTVIGSAPAGGSGVFSFPEIGRASCRERVKLSVVAVTSKKK